MEPAVQSQFGKDALKFQLSSVLCIKNIYILKFKIIFVKDVSFYLFLAQSGLE